MKLLCVNINTRSSKVPPFEPLPLHDVVRPSPNEMQGKLMHLDHSSQGRPSRHEHTHFEQETQRKSNLGTGDFSQAYMLSVGEDNLPSGIVWCWKHHFWHLWKRRFISRKDFFDFDTYVTYNDDSAVKHQAIGNLYLSRIGCSVLVLWHRPQR